MNYAQNLSKLAYCNFRNNNPGPARVFSAHATAFIAAGAAHSNGKSAFELAGHAYYCETI